jgi:CRISPR-associated endonuclease/helicase Cas3
MTDKGVWARGLLAKALGVSKPFPWQIELLDRFLNARLPSAVDIPTGLGKTAVMAIWLVSRAAGAKVPRRLVYVVDRRAVVDHATEVAQRLREFVESDAELKRALGLEGPLPISTLRGKLLDNRAWLADPSAPAIVLGTVDIIGSRLLFGGYGVSRRMRPYYAGLLGADSLIVLDEAHLVPPFERLVEALASGRDTHGQSLGAQTDHDGIVPPLLLLSLSATGRTRGDGLHLSSRDFADPAVAERLKAIKRMAVHDPVDARELPDKLAEIAWGLSGSGTKPLRCIVFCDGRDDAERVKEALEYRARKKSSDWIDIDLLVDARRFFERDMAAQWLCERGFLAGSETRPPRVAFVIATSAGEVGIDLDGDAMVCDLVAWERMVQRLGRVNRRGQGKALVIVVPTRLYDAEQQARHRAVLALLAELPAAQGGTVDASPGALVALKERRDSEPRLADLIERASAPAELHPPLARATVEAWSMTSLQDHPGRPVVAPWLRGWAEPEEPRTTVVWRTHLPVTDHGRLLPARDLENFLEVAGPHLAERLETDRSRVVMWLAHRLKTLKVAKVADATHDADRRSLRQTPVAAVVLDGRAGMRPRALNADDLSSKDKRDEVARALTGALLLVDVRLGGLSKEGLLDAESNWASDITQAPQRVVPFRVRRIPSSEGTAGHDWREEARVAVAGDDDEETAWLLIESRAEEAAESEWGRSVAKRDQKLEEHRVWTERAAARIAERLALPQPHSHMLTLAARLHDEGKRAACWQRAFRAPSDDVYAKTKSCPNLRVLGTYRHELGSLSYGERDERVQALDTSLRDLCLHLIAAHHGNARPLLRTDGGEEPPTRLEARAREIATRFARLEREWGPWGLAWWEALLRAADQEASRKNDLQGVLDG